MNKLIQDLSKTQAYPEKHKKIQIIQTHISIVFIGDEFVYKIKKKQIPKGG